MCSRGWPTAPPQRCLLSHPSLGLLPVRLNALALHALWRLKTETIIGDPAGKNGQIGYGYDAVGNREWRTSTVAGLGAQGFGFDANDRLQGDTYDANGNTRSGASSQPAGAFTALPSPVALAGSQSAAQPIMGSDIYDGENRLVERTGAGGGKVEVVYDGDGHKVREIVTRNGITTTASYLVDELNPTGYAQVVEEKTNGTLTRVYTYGHDLISQDQLIGSSTLGTWKLSYFGYDGHGNVRFLTDETGAVTDRYDFDAFGTLLAMSGSTPNAYLYCGEQYDGALGLYYLRARLMNPLTGRFWTADSYEGKNSEPASLHKYLYAHADPVNGWDPSGKVTLMELGAAQSIISTLSHIKADVGFATMAEIEDGSGMQSLIVGGALMGAVSVTPRAMGLLRTLLQKYGDDLYGRPSARFLHDLFVRVIRNSTVERTVRTAWSASRGVGDRKYDNYEPLTNTAFEMVTHSWSSLGREELQRKLKQVADDFHILSRGGDGVTAVSRVIWVGMEELPSTGLAGQLKIALEQAGIPYWVIPGIR